MLAFQPQQPVLVHQRAAVDFAAAQHGGDAGGDFAIVRTDEAALQHVDQHHPEGRDADIAGHLDSPRRQGRAIPGLGQRQCLLAGDMQQLVGVEHDRVAAAQQAEFLGLERGGADLGHRHGLERGLELGEHVATRPRSRRRAHRQFLQAATGRQQANPGFHQPDVTFQVGHGARGVHLEFAAAAQRQAANRRDHRHQRILDALAGGLEVGNHGIKAREVARLQQAQRAGQVGAGRERFLRLPDDHAAKIALGDADRFLQTVEHLVVDGVQLGLEAGHGDAVAVVPEAQAVVLEHGLAWRGRFAQQRVREALALVDGQGGARQLGVAARAVAALCAMHAVAAVEHPVRQRRVAHGLAGHDVVGNPFGYLFPARRLPGLERPQRPAIAPANRKVHVARGLGDVGQMIGAVVEQVAEHRPQEARLRMLAGAEPGELLGGIAQLEDLDHLWRSNAIGRAVVLLGKVQHHDVLANLAEDAAAGLLAQRALGDQRVQPCGRLEVRMPGVAGQGIGHGLDHVGHGVQAHHVRSAVGRRLGPPDQRAGDCIDLVEAQPEFGRVVRRGQDREHADPVADEIGGIARVHHALAQGSDQEAFQTFQD